MKKLFVLACALFLTGTFAFAQSEKTVKPENKAKTESVDKKAQVEPAKKEVKLESAETKAKVESTKKEVKLESTNKNLKVNKSDKKTAAPVKKDVKAEEKVAKEALDKKAKDDEKKKLGNESDKSVTIPAAQNENGPEITFKETHHDFGNIPFKGNGSYEFEFENTGKEPLVLTQPKSSCGCTVPEWPKQPILPGEKNVIKVTYKNTDRPGNFNKYVTVFSNAVVNKEVKLYIKGTIESEPTDAAPLKMESVGSPVNKN